MARVKESAFSNATQMFYTGIIRIRDISAVRVASKSTEPLSIAPSMNEPIGRAMFRGGFGSDDTRIRG